MPVTINVHYTGEGDAANRFVREMMDSGLLSAVRAERGCQGYEYFTSVEDGHKVLLVEHWTNEAALDAHIGGENMKGIDALKQRFGLDAAVERYVYRN